MHGKYIKIEIEMQFFGSEGQVIQIFGSFMKQIDAPTIIINLILPKTILCYYKPHKSLQSIISPFKFSCTGNSKNKVWLPWNISLWKM